LSAGVDEDYVGFVISFIWKVGLIIFRFLETISYIRIMVIIEVSTGRKCHIDILAVENTDYNFLPKSKYAFDWKKEKGNEVYKLLIKGQQEVLGLISIERIPSEWRIHIRLLTVSIENMGKGKQYEGIAGNLIAFVAKIAVASFGELACISLKPKTSIAQHYIDQYKMNITGLTLSLEVPEIINLIKHYDHD
jgi:hypothetical protein